MFEIPPYLVEQIKEGKAILLLGSGASMEAIDDKGNHPPTGKELAKLLSDKFLGGKYSDYLLAQVGELAINESTLTAVQEYIREIFERFRPTEAHRLITTFRWEGLATTNYDRLIELAYAGEKKAVQTPQPFIENGDQIQDKMRDPNSVKLLKLHGCITRTNNPRCPLILTPEQYITHRQGRKRLFDQIYDWALERPIVFVGQSLQDSDLRQLLLELISESGEQRPRYYAIAPNFDVVQQRFWESKKISCIDTAFLGFMNALDNAISTPFRGVRKDYSALSHPISLFFVHKDRNISDNCKRFLDMEVDYVKECTKEENIDPRKFYRGMDLGWAAIEQNLDVQRQISDEIISDVFLTDPLVNKNTPQIVLVNAHAGAGKSVILRRIAWDAAYLYDCICLYLRHHGKIDWLALQELAGLCTKRIFLFIDNAADHTQELQQLVEKIGPEGGQLTVLIAERTNEWNMVGEDYQNLVSKTYDLSYLTEHEIDSLLALLKEHKALGTIEHCSIEEQREAFKKKAGRQILVALHEATLGKPFEEIVVDEYKNIQPIEAQSMYLSVCVLNRLNVDVRAGIISRIHGIRFADFKSKFFFPLEEVIQTKYDPVVRDFVYGARHPLIADMVFINVLTNQDERFDAYIKCFKALNVDYSSDKSAFQQMIRAHSLCDLFTNPDLIKTVFKAAQLMSVGDPYVLQQMAIFEMHHKTGNLDIAAELLLKAQSQAPYSKTIKHSLSEIHLRLADQAQTELQHKKYLAEAESIARSLIKLGTGDSHPYHTLCKIGLRRIQAVLDVKDEEFSRTTFEQLVKSIEKDLSDGLQNFPNDPFLLDSESKLGTLLADSRRALSALEKAFEANHRNSWFAIRLSRAYQMQKNIEKAKDVLKKGLDANNNSHELHYYYAKLLLSTEQSNSEEIRYHLRRSFSPGDANYDAQILYARELYLSGQIDESKEIFDSLHNVRLSPDNINQIRYPLEKESQGSIAKIETTYCFIQRDGVADWIFAHRNNVDRELWDNLTRDSRVKFKIGFTMKGPSAFDVRKLEVK